MGYRYNVFTDELDITSAPYDPTTDTIHVLKAGDTMTGALIVDGSADAKQLVVQGHSTQTNNLTEWQNSSGTALTAIQSSGNLLFSNAGYIQPTTVSGVPVLQITNSGSGTFYGLSVKANSAQALFSFDGGVGGLGQFLNQNGHFYFSNAGAADIFFRTSGSAIRMQISGADGKVYIGTGADTNIYRGAANLLKTDDIFQATSFMSAVTTKTANYTAVASDSTILVDTTAGAVTITLPTPVGIAGNIFNIKKITTDGNNMIITSVAGNVEGAVDITTGATTRPSYTLQSDNANWWVI